MIEPGTEKQHPPRERNPRRKPRPQKVAVAAAEGEAAPPREGAERPRRDRPKRRQERGRRPPQRTGAYEKRAAKKLVPITKAMEEGKEYMRSFGDLLQFHQKKQQPEADADGAGNGEQSAS